MKAITKLTSLLLLSLSLLMLNGCIFNWQKQPTETTQLDEQAYPVLVVFEAPIVSKYNLELEELKSLLDWQNHHYRPDLSFNLIIDDGQLATHSNCLKNPIDTMHKAIEVFGDRYVSCILESGSYRSFAYISQQKNGGLAINLFNRNLHPRLGYFNLVENQYNDEILAGELFLWMNEQASFADLKTW